MAHVIAEAFPIEGQRALQPVDALVTDFARTLGVDPPAVRVHNPSFTRIDAVRAVPKGSPDPGARGSKGLGGKVKGR